MKIKKKEYKRKLKDEYWRGVEAGINFAKARPDIVNDLDINQIRSGTEKATKAFEKLAKRLVELFGNKG